MRRRLRLRIGRLALIAACALLAGCDALVDFLASDPPRPGGRSSDADSAESDAIHADDGWLRSADPHATPEEAWAPRTFPARLQLDVGPDAPVWLALPPAPTGYRIRVASAESATSLLWRSPDATVHFEREGLGVDESAQLGAGVAWHVGVRAEQRQTDLRLVIERNLDAPCGPFGDDSQVVATALALPASLQSCGSGQDPGPGLRLDWSMLAEQGVFGLQLSHAASHPLQLEVRDADGTIWAQWSVPAAGELSIPALRRPGAPGHAVVHVRSGGRVLDVPWSLHVHPPPDAGEARLETEPNDSPEQAQAIPDMRPIAGSLHSPDDVDWFVLAPHTPRLLSLEIEAVGEPGVSLHVSSPEAFPASLIQAEEGAERVRICQVRPSEEDPLVFAIALPHGSEEIAALLPYRITLEALDRDPAWAHASARDADSLLRAWHTRGEEEGDTADGLPGERSASTGSDAAPSDRPASAERGAGGADGPTAPGIWLSGEQLGTEARGLLDPQSSDTRVLLHIPESPTRVSTSLTLEPGGPHRYRISLLDDEGAMIATSEAPSPGSLARAAADLPGGDYVVRIEAPRGGCLPPWLLRLESEALPGSAPEAIPGSGEGEGERAPARPTPAHPADDPAVPSFFE